MLNHTALIRSAGMRRGFRYWRIRVTDQVQTAAGAGLTEIEFRSSIGGADLTSVSTVVSASIETYPPSPASNLVDNSTSTSWDSLNQATYPYTLTFDFGVEVVPKELAIHPIVGAYFRAPKDFSVQASSDGVTYSTVKSFAGMTSWAASFSIFAL
jgi:hypothetical protein